MDLPGLPMDLLEDNHGQYFLGFNFSARRYRRTGFLIFFWEQDDALQIRVTITMALVDDVN